MLKIVAAVVMLTGVALANPPALAPYKANDFTVSFPKAWVVTQQQGILAAQQDPKRKDSAAILFIYSAAAPTTTEDALLDGITGQLSKDFKVTTRAAASAQGGHYLIGDGTVDATKVRVGALAVIANGQTIVSVLVAKPADFDALGGITLATMVAASLRRDAPATQVAPAAPATSTTAGPHALTDADLAGDWVEDANALQGYVSSSTGNYAGYSSASTTDHYVFDGKGGYSEKGTAAIVSSTRVSTSASGGVGATSIRNNVLYLKRNDHKFPEFYYLRGMQVKGDVTILTLNGVWNTEADALKVGVDERAGRGLDRYWVRAPKKK